MERTAGKGRTTTTEAPLLAGADTPQTPDVIDTQAVETETATPAKRTKAMARQQVAEAPSVGGMTNKTATMFERLARDPNVPVEKLERLIALQEHVMGRESLLAFGRDFAAMQHDLPKILKTREGDNGKWMFASLDDVLKAVRPVLAQHGFSHRWSTDYDADWIVVTCHLVHREGHTETSKFRAKADKTGSKNDIQAQGSSREYARRYSLLDVLGVSTGLDDDGAGSERDEKEQAPMPPGWEDWAISLETVAEDGFDALMKAWRASKEQFRNYMMSTYRPKWEAVKRSALKADEKAGRKPVVVQGSAPRGGQR